MGWTLSSRKHSNSAAAAVCTFVLLLLLFVLPATPASAQQPKQEATLAQYQFRNIGSVGVRADGPIDETAMLQLINIRPGETLTASNIRAAIEALYTTGNFTNILVDATERPDGQLDVTFLVRLVYRFRFVHFKGNLGVGSRKLRKQIQLRKLEPYTPEKVLKAREQIVKTLYDNGYFNPHVSQDVLLHRTTKRADVLYTVEAGAPAYLGSLNITGVPSSGIAQLRDVLKMHVGKRFRETELHRSIDRLDTYLDQRGWLEHSLKLLPQVADRANRVQVDLQVNPGRKMDLQLHGYSMKEENIRDEIPIWSDHSYNDDTLEEGKKNLLQHLQTQGYFKAAVTWKKDVTAAKTSIIYTIEPGKQYMVRSIRISGNEHLPTEEIREQIKTHESGVFTTHRLVTTVFEADLDRVISIYKDRGYLFARWTGQDIHVDPGGAIDIDLRVDEGPRSIVNEIRIRGNTAIPSDYLLSNFQEQVGMAVSPTKIRDDSGFIVAVYSDHGYPKMSLENKVLLSAPDKTRATIEYHITEGEQVRVNRIILSGNWRTPRDVITRNLFFKEGDPLSMRKIAASQSRLYSLEIFDRVEMDVPRPDTMQQHQDVTIRVTEARPYTISYGFGYQTFDKLRGLFSISDRNLLGTDRSLALQLRGGFEERRAVLSYTDTHLFARHITNTVEGFAERRVPHEGFSYKRWGFALSAERRLSPDPAEVPIGQKVPTTQSVFMRYELENIDTHGTPADTPLERPFNAIHISSITSGYVRDGRDNIINPRTGYYFTSQMQWATNLLGSETDFVKWTSQMEHFTPLHRSVIAASFRIGIARGYRNTGELPLSQRFFAGGGRTIRGFDTDMVGPLDLYGNPLGGNAEIIANLEYRYPIFGNLGGVVFFDYGGVFSYITGGPPLTEPPPSCCNSVSLRDMRKTAGLGLRYYTPIGPVTLDWGYKLDRRLHPVPLNPLITESASEFFVSVGHAF